jgi:DNA-binding response OmpR family regulator
VVALRLFRPTAGPSHEFFKRLRRSSAVIHPNLVPTLGAGVFGGIPFGATAVPVGPSLRETVERNGPLSAEEALRLARALATGLSALHRVGIVHDRVHPDNVFPDWHGTVRLGDYELSGPAEGRFGLDRYRPPEEADGRPTDARSDLYRLGMLLFEVVVGPAPDGVATPPPAATGLPELIHELTRADPADRRQTCYELLAALDEREARPAPVTSDDTILPIEDKRRVLVVDESRPVLQVLGDILEGAGFEAYLESDPDLALALLRRIRIKVVLVPRRHGAQAFVEAVARDHPATQVVVFSEPATEECGCDDPLGKAAALLVANPYQPEHVVEAVERAYAESGRSLLLVDEVRLVRLAVSGMFENLGYRVRAVGSLDEAVSEIDREPPDVIIADLDLRAGGGLALLQLVRERHPSIPVIILAATATVEQVIETFRLGACDFIIKSTDSSPLIRAVSHARSRRPPN